ncbi:hypothetical protein K3495_g1038 [Podosphaera aphanis]|nr:hypothetical protein K3495_g1038 [Podosphaera aphanis]
MARTEAWRGGSWSPWRRSSERDRSHDVEGTADSEIDTENEAIDSNSQRQRSRHIRISSKERNVSSGNIYQQGPTLEATENKDAREASGNTGSGVPSTRHRFRGSTAGTEGSIVHEKETPKKRPWYKGKDLKHEPFTFKNQIQATILNSWINILLLAAPPGLILRFAGADGKIVFLVNFFAIIPLAGMLGYATEEIALHVGESTGGLLNASFGNAVEIIVAVIALSKDEIVIVQTSLIGSILSNLLFVMGMCFFFGGIRREEQFFNETVAQTTASLLALSIGSIVIPTCFERFAATENEALMDNVAAISRGTAVILLFVYGGYLYFQLFTHQIMFNVKSQKVAMKPRKNTIEKGATLKGLASAGAFVAGTGQAARDGVVNLDATDEVEEHEAPQIHIAVAWSTLIIATIIIGMCAESMVSGIAAITEDGKISIEFVGLILLPLVSNAAEHATAVTVAVKDKMDLAIAVAVGSSMQISLLVIPLLIVVGWIMGKDDMTLSFDGFQVSVLFVSVLLVNYLISDGKTHWLEGMLLMCLYL